MTTSAMTKATARWGDRPHRQHRIASLLDPNDVSFDHDDAGRLVVLCFGQLYETPVPPADLKNCNRLVPGHPGWITLALDSRGLDGPEVDEALGVPEPTVDEWEAGRLRPTETELLRLATLTHYPPHFFSDPEPPIKPSPMFICWLDASSNDDCLQSQR